jgi:hypothetical protein
MTLEGRPTLFLIQIQLRKVPFISNSIHSKPKKRRDLIMNASEAKAKALLKAWRSDPEH